MDVVSVSHEILTFSIFADIVSTLLNLSIWLYKAFLYQVLNRSSTDSHSLAQSERTWPQPIKQLIVSYTWKLDSSRNCLITNRQTQKKVNFRATFSSIFVLNVSSLFCSQSSSFCFFKAYWLNKLLSMFPEWIDAVNDPWKRNGEGRSRKHDERCFEIPHRLSVSLQSALTRI